MQAEHVTLRDVPQLADVTGPSMGHQGLQVLPPRMQRLAVVAERELRREGLEQQRDVLPPFAQRRDADLRDVDAVKEVWPEGAGVGRPLQSDLCRRDRP